MRKVTRRKNKERSEKRVHKLQLEQARALRRAQKAQTA
ncbi:hypothetical protein MM26B8_00810 [Mycoplasmopsis meleagridis]|nr:hypothetical protein MM26B8_00810 [Mycoplasmopsis meleagridis]VEU77670.1 possible MarR-family transcription repressor [Mycoplasmopsis meleagridis]